VGYQSHDRILRRCHRNFREEQQVIDL
jgi:hypothetical protein